MDLTSNIEFKICQNLYLYDNYKYKLSFDTFPQKIITNYSIIISLNNSIIYNKYY